VAEIYERINGRKLTRHIAGMPGVQYEIGRRTQRMAQHADALLAEHHHDGHAKIETKRGRKRIDRYLILSDTRGLGAALSIERGRKEDTKSPWGPMEGLFILARSTGLPKHRKG